jgi:DNA-binding NarL/FixJ family response regulator
VSDVVSPVLIGREREPARRARVPRGRSTRRIAPSISPKTASVQVSNILAELRVGGRVEAAGVAHRLGLVAAPTS